jgi:uncharacterized protein (TIGR03435 family)
MSTLRYHKSRDRVYRRVSFDFTLDPIQFATADSNGTPVHNAANNFGDLVVTALSEQLGFNLEKRKAALEITVIDHAEKPTDN